MDTSNFKKGYKGVLKFIELGGSYCKDKYCIIINNVPKRYTPTTFNLLIAYLKFGYIAFGKDNVVYNLKGFSNLYDSVSIQDKGGYSGYYRQNNMASKIRYDKLYYLNNKERIYNRDKITTKLYRDANRASIRDYNREHYKRNKRKLNDYRQDLIRKLKEEGGEKWELHIIKCNIRGRLNNAIKSQGTKTKNNGAFLDLVGCSPEDCKRYIESLFAEGMSWDNYGMKGWHIDHIKPLCSFDLLEEAQVKEASHYTNLQPLWAEDNLRKGGRTL